MVDSRPNPITFAVALLCYLLLFAVIAAGFQFIAGRAHPCGIVYKLVGAVMVVAGIAGFGSTLRRWSDYFFAACVLAALKALFALFAGYTISQPRVVVHRAQAAEMLALLIAMSLLSFPYASHPPRTALQSISLVSALVGLAAGVALDPNPWPVVGGVILLALPLLVGNQKSRTNMGTKP